MLEVSVVHVLPLSVYSSFTLDTPEADQVMLCVLPAAQLSPPLGLVRVMPGAGVRVEALAGVDSLPAASTAVTW